MSRFLARLKLAVAITAVAVLGITVDVQAQGPFSAQIQAALRAFLTQAHTWTGTQTFTDVTVNGTCTGCTGGSVVSSITGTANQVIASASTGDITLSAPQDLATTSSPRFAASTFGSLSAPYGVTTITSPQTSTNHSFSLNITQQPPIITTVVANGSGSCTTGDHNAVLTVVSSAGTGSVESLPSLPATVTCNGTNRFNITAYPLPPIGVSAVNMYMSKAGTTTPLFFCATTGPTSTSIVCSTADGSLSATQPPSTQPTLIQVMRWQQNNNAFASGGSGLQLWPNESAGSGDFTFTTQPANPGVLKLGNTTSTGLRNFAVGNMYVGSSTTAYGDRAHITSTELAVGTSNIHKWCSNVDASTCDTGLSRNAAAVIEVNTGTAGVLGAFKGLLHLTTIFQSTTAPTIASGGCTSPAVTSNNGTGAFLLTLGTSCTGVKTITLTMPAAAHFWACSANNNTSAGQQDANTIASLASSTTAVVLTNYARTTGLQTDFTASDTLLVQCSGE